MEHQLVIVLGRNQNARLGMIRACGKAGYDVAVIYTFMPQNKTILPIDRMSKYVNCGYYRVMESDNEGLLQILLKNFTHREHKPILIPTEDYIASVIDLNTEVLKKYFLFPNIGYEQGKVVSFMNKTTQKELAKKAGFLVAEGWTARWSNNMYSITQDVLFPCFVKPEISYIGIGKSIMKRCDDIAELRNALSRFKGREDYPILVEQYIDIEYEYAVLGYCDSEKIAIPGIITMIRGNHGVTAEGIVKPIDSVPGLSQMIEEFMKLVGFTGLFDIDLYESNGNIYFSELNLRFGASGYAITKSGINLPDILISRLTQKECEVESPAVKEISFANEMVLLALLAQGKTSIEEYKKAKRDADFLLVTDDADPRPCLALKKEELVSAAKYLIKRALNR